MNPYDDTQQNIRSDKWLDMNTSELNEQRDIIVNRMTAISTITQNPTTYMLFVALQQALNDVDHLINTKMTNN